jgi:hypothetical protein
VVLYEFPHHSCRILDPQGCWAVGGDVRMADITLSVDLGSTWNQSYTWNQGWTTGLCHTHDSNGGDERGFPVIYEYSGLLLQSLGGQSIMHQDGNFTEVHSTNKTYCSEIPSFQEVCGEWTDQQADILTKPVRVDLFPKLRYMLMGWWYIKEGCFATRECDDMGISLSCMTNHQCNVAFHVDTSIHGVDSILFEL